MVKLQRRQLDAPDEVRDVPLGRIDTYHMGDMSVGRTVFQPGWRWSVSIKPVAGTEMCEFHHFGYCLSGRCRVVSREGTELEVGPEQIYEIPPGHDAWVVGDEPWVTIDWFAGAAYGRPAVGAAERVVATLLFTDIVDSTATARRVGDAAWRDVLARHNQVVRAELDRFRGREVDTAGDGFLAVFDGAERAVRAAQEIVTAMPRIGLETRAGIHSGEVEFEGTNVRGLSVHLAARVMALAAPSEVLVSWTTRELLAGSPIGFVDRGLHELKGLPESRRVYAATPTRSG